MLSTSRRLTRLLAPLVALLSVLFVWLGPAQVARAADTVNDLTIDSTLDASGTLKVTEKYTFDAAPAEFTQRISLGRDGADNKEYRHQVDGVKVTADGKDVAAKVEQGSDAVVVTVPTHGAKKVELTYTVKGATVKLGDGATELRWRYLQGLSLPVTNVTVNLIPAVSWTDIDCKAGDPAAPKSCKTFTGGVEGHMTPFFNDGPLGANAVMEVSLRFPNGVAATESVRERWSLDRAFSLKLLPLLSALGALLLGGMALWAMHRGAGRDAAFAKPTRVAEFRPVGEGQSEFNLLTDVRPGQVGTLMDEQVDPVDVTASIIDLAVRGHLRIIELPRSSAHAATDWTFERREAGRDALRPYEAKLIDALAPADGTQVRVSQIGPSVTAVIPQVQSDLYDEMVAQKWYERRPDSTRNRWTGTGWAAVVVALVALALLVAFTQFGLLGLALVALAIGLLIVGHEMPARTASGASVLGGLMDLRGQLMTAPTDQMPKGREYHELSEVLPYATVLGGQDRWLAAIAAADDDVAPDPTDLDWYHAPETWQLSDLPASMDAFVTTVTGKLFRRA